jgi:hypothetical protein
MIAWASAAGCALKPVVIILHKTTEIEFYEHGFMSDVVSLVRQDFAQHNFLKNGVTVFFPDMHEQRARMGSTRMVFLILEGFTGQKTKMIEEAFIQSGAFEVVLPLHSSDWIQRLGPVIFAVHKMESHRIYAHVDLNSQTRKLLKTLCGWGTATTPLNIIAAMVESSGNGTRK